MLKSFHNLFSTMVVMWNKKNVNVIIIIIIIIVVLCTSWRK